jgi:hypothetical protein
MTDMEEVLGFDAFFIFNHLMCLNINVWHRVSCLNSGINNGEEGKWYRACRHVLMWRAGKAATV